MRRKERASRKKRKSSGKRTYVKREWISIEEKRGIERKKKDCEEKS